MASSQQAGRASEGLEEPLPLLLWSTSGGEPGHRGSDCSTGQLDLNTHRFTDLFTGNILFVWPC